MIPQKGKILKLPASKLMRFIPLRRGIFQHAQGAQHKKGSFPLRISSVNVTESAIYGEIGHILHFLCSGGQEGSRNQ